MFLQLWTSSRTRENRAPRNRRHRTPAFRPETEALDDRCLLSTDVVIEGNQAVLAAIRPDRPKLGRATPDLARAHTAIRVAVNAFDNASRGSHAHSHAPTGAAAGAAAAVAGLLTASALTGTAIFHVSYQPSLVDDPDSRAKTKGTGAGRPGALPTDGPSR